MKEKRKEKNIKKYFKTKNPFFCSILKFLVISLVILICLVPNKYCY